MFLHGFLLFFLPFQIPIETESLINRTKLASPGSPRLVSQIFPRNRHRIGLEREKKTREEKEEAFSFGEREGKGETIPWKGGTIPLLIFVRPKQYNHLMRHPPRQLA